MLFGIPPSLPSELLHILASMGHGDELTIVDLNFPAYANAKHTVTGKVVELGQDAPSAIADILSLMPLDTFVDEPVCCMEVPGDALRLSSVQKAVQAHLDQVVPGKPWPLHPVKRMNFYDRARNSFAIVRTQELRPYGCFLFTKGVLTPEGDLMTPEFASRFD